MTRSTGVADLCKGRLRQAQALASRLIRDVDLFPCLRIKTFFSETLSEMFPPVLILATVNVAVTVRPDTTSCRDIPGESRGAKRLSASVMEAAGSGQEVSRAVELIFSTLLFN